MRNIPILNITQFKQQEPLVDFYSNELSKHLNKNNAIIEKPHKHDFFLCVLFTEGTGIHEIDFNSYSINPGSIFFLRPGQTHFWKFKSKPKGYIFFHTQNFYELYFSNTSLTQFPFFYTNNNPPYAVINRHQLTEIEYYFKKINVEFHKHNIYKQQKIASLINLLYIDLSRIYSEFGLIDNKISLTYLRTLRLLENTIDAFYKTEKSAEFYAEKLNITPKHLNRIVKSTINKTTSQLISERVMLEAKRLIVHSKNSLAAISELLGYEDYAYFSRVFKLKTGVTPISFRKRF